MKKQMLRSAVLVLIFLFLFQISSIAAEISTKNSKVIRVGYPLQEGLTMIDENGGFYGYTYDYLLEMSQYTGWKYEIVLVEGSANEQASASLEMLLNGQIDLMGGINYNAAFAADYAYPGYSYGTNYSGIFVPEDSVLTELVLYSTEHIKVGVFNKALKKSQQLEQFAQMNGLDIEQVFVASSGEYKALLQNGQVDALLSTDLAIQEHDGMYAIAHFSPSPFYFATKKGNVEIVRQLDYAISTINKVNPNFGVQLYNKYFSKATSSLFLSSEEQDFIKNSNVIEVAMYNNKPPFQYIDSKTGEPAGITVEVLDYISENTGITFHYKQVSTYEEYTRLIKDGEVNISSDTLLNYQEVEDLNTTLTLPWHSLPLYLMFREGTPMEMDGIYAAPYSFKNVISDSNHTIYFDTIEACMEAVQKRKATYCYVDEFSGQYMSNSGAYDNLKFMNHAEVTSQKLSFGICNTDDFHLLSIFNKAIAAMPQDKIEEIIYKNTYVKQEIALKTLIKQHQTFLAIAATLLVALLCAIYVYRKGVKQKQIALENQRYHTLSNLANEYFYEYYVLSDTLILSDKCAEYFSCDTKIRRFSKTLSAMTPEERTGIWDLGTGVTKSSKGSQEVCCKMPNHREQWFNLVSSVIYNKKKQVYVIGKVMDIQTIKSREMDLEQAASMDGLTGIYNIATIKNLIQERLKHGDMSSPRTLMILDVDDFKQINDQFGHYKGDDVLILIAQLVSDVFYPNLVGRLGGDEFIVFTENLEVQELKERCDAICHTLREKINDMLGVAFGVSIGITLVQKGQLFDDLYKEADKALYQRKLKNKNGYLFYDKGKTMVKSRHVKAEVLT